MFPFDPFRYQIVDFQLPNDGFVYSPRYSAGGDELKLGRDDVANFLDGFVASVDKVPDFNPILRVNYKLGQSTGLFFF